MATNINNFAHTIFHFLFHVLLTSTHSCVLEIQRLTLSLSKCDVADVKKLPAVGSG